MDTIVPRVCGLDVHEASVVACVLIDGGKKRGSKKVRTFTAMRSDIVALRQWLLEEGVTQVVMEGTGIYWRPVYETCEDAFDVWVVNARHVKNVPGRKSDVIDAEWLAKLLSSGLLRKSFPGQVSSAQGPPAEALRAIRDRQQARPRHLQSSSPAGAIASSVPPTSISETASALLANSSNDWPASVSLATSF